MTRDELFMQLLTRTRENSGALDKHITESLETVGAVMVCDSSGFTRMTRSQGILHFLAMLMQSYDLSIPIVKQHGGVLIKSEADNLIARFETADAAVACAMEIQDAHFKRNTSLEHEDEHFHVCIGIEYGTFLKLEDDIFGDAVNVAYKLGEDVAGRSEILVTENVSSMIKDKLPVVGIGSQNVGNIDMPLYRVEWQQC
jgi:adenylate cyclase